MFLSHERVEEKGGGEEGGEGILLRRGRRHTSPAHHGFYKTLSKTLWP
jgi:hypothetical protein